MLLGLDTTEGFGELQVRDRDSEPTHDDVAPTACSVVGRIQEGISDGRLGRSSESPSPVVEMVVLSFSSKPIAATTTTFSVGLKLSTNPLKNWNEPAKEAKRFRDCPVPVLRHRLLQPLLVRNDLFLRNDSSAHAVCPPLFPCM